MPRVNNTKYCVKFNDFEDECSECEDQYFF